MNWEDIKTQEPEKQQATKSGWGIKNLLEDNNLLQGIKSEWDWTSKEKAHLSILFTNEDLDKEFD